MEHKGKIADINQTTFDSHYLWKLYPNKFSTDTGLVMTESSLVGEIQNWGPVNLCSQHLCHLINILPCFMYVSV